MKKLLLAFAATLGLCAFGSLAHAGPEGYESRDSGYERSAPRADSDYERPARPAPRRRVVVTRTYLPLLPPLPFLPPPPSIQIAEQRTVIQGGGGRRRHRRAAYGYRRSYYEPGVRVGVGVGY